MQICLTVAAGRETVRGELLLLDWGKVGRGRLLVEVRQEARGKRQEEELFTGLKGYYWELFDKISLEFALISGLTG